MKRAAIARAISLNPKYLFCDEPNSGLDPKTSLLIDDLIHDITVEVQYDDRYQYPRHELRDEYW